MAHINETATVKTDWDNLPLGENLSHLCGGRNKHKTAKAEETEATQSGEGWNIPTAKDILSNLNLG